MEKVDKPSKSTKELTQNMYPLWSQALRKKSIPAEYEGLVELVSRCSRRAGNYVENVGISSDKNMYPL